ncbi:MAG: glycosyltransferase [Pyrinomonadaceae bacterium]
MPVFYLLAASLVFFSYKSLRGGINYLNFFKQELAKPKSNFTPFCSIIAPCRGLDADLEKNLNALFEQDFPRYEIVFVVDDETDESVLVIEKVRENFHHRDTEAQRFSKIIFAGKAQAESQKVHNLRRAVLEVSAESEVYVFVDSDARPDKEWLRNLIAPLGDETVGAATGYRWFVQKRGGLATQFRAVWNASIASALGANLKSNFCWGGSLAMRRETFEKLEMREKWRGTLSDDFTVTRRMKEANLAIYFVPQCLTASVEDCTFRELLEFTTRQMKITRVYAGNLWKQSLLGAILFNLVFIWGILILIFYRANTFGFWFALVSLFLIFVFSTGKSRLRLNAVRLILKDYERELRRQFWFQNTLWIFTPALFLYNNICALFSRKIVWRDIAYELKSATETVIINRSRE